MRLFLLSLFLFVFNSNDYALAQDGLPEDNYVEDEIGQEIDPEQKEEQNRKDVISVECKCPENSIEEEEAHSAVNDLFPENSIFVIQPESERIQPQSTEKEPKEVNDSVPGYDLKEARGYSDDSYLPIPTE